MNRTLFTKILAIFGTIFVCLPCLAPVIFSTIRLLQGDTFLFDFLMPAESSLLLP
jgi:hypothetical protein